MRRRRITPPGPGTIRRMRTVTVAVHHEIDIEDDGAVTRSDVVAVHAFTPEGVTDPDEVANLQTVAREWYAALAQSINRPVEPAALTGVVQPIDPVTTTDLTDSPAVRPGDNVPGAAEAQEAANERLITTSAVQEDRHGDQNPAVDPTEGSPLD